MAWVNYKQLREELDIAQVIADYGIELRGSGVQRKCVCPVEACRDPKERTVSVNTEKGVFRCWRCDVKGNTIDFAAIMEGLDPIDTRQFRQAAIKLADKYGIQSERNAPSRTDEKGKVHRRASAPKRSDGKQNVRLTNEPLDFELKDLDPEHESVQALGLRPETVKHFGLGYCTRRGMLQGRIAIPLPDSENRLIGYAGRLADPEHATQEHPLYRLPDKGRTRTSDGAILSFDASAFVYRSLQLIDPVPDLIVVEQIHQVWQLHEAERAPAVATLGPCTREQVAAIAERVEPTGCVWFLVGSPDAVPAVSQVAQHRYVRWLFAADDNAVLKQAGEVPY
jgi:DNA primase